MNVPILESERLILRGFRRIGHENKPSLKLAHQFGFKEVARTIYKDHPTTVLYREP